jgi:hypothetical protein
LPVVSARTPAVTRRSIERPSVGFVVSTQEEVERLFAEKVRSPTTSSGSWPWALSEGNRATSAP